MLFMFESRVELWHGGGGLQITGVRDLSSVVFLDFVHPTV